jgi:hypothetical protein
MRVKHVRLPGDSESPLRSSSKRAVETTLGRHSVVFRPTQQRKLGGRWSLNTSRARADECATSTLNCAIEELVFPPQVFFSAGLVVQKSICSICGTEYGDCFHVVGRPYMRELCRRILTNVVPDHVAIVNEPANKRCRGPDMCTTLRVYFSHGEIHSRTLRHRARQRTP